MSPFRRPPLVLAADRLLALSVFLVLLAFYTATMATQPDVPDGEVEFQTTSALVRERTFALGGTPEADAIVDLSFNVHAGGPGREQETFSWFGVGQAWVGVPFYVAGSFLGELLPDLQAENTHSTHMGVERSEYFEHLLVGWRNPVLAALTAALVALSTRRLGAGRPSAWIAGMTLGLCTYLWPQARSTLNNVQATFFLFLAFHQVLAIEDSLGRLERPRRITLFLCGLALGGAFLTRSLVAPTLVVVGLALLVVLWRARRARRGKARWHHLIWVLVPALACLGLFFWTNQLRFGDPLEQGYAGVVDWAGYFNYPLHHGLAGILLSTGKGLLWLAPGVLLGLYWVALLLRRREWRMPLVLCGMGIAVLLPVGLTVGWHGAWGYGPRYALPLVPFLWLGVAPALEHLRGHPRLRPVAGALFLLGLIVNLPGVLVDTSTHHSLATEAARLEWPDTELEGNAATRDEERFQRICWDPRFAAPWAHWRILRHRLAGLGEDFPLEEIFYVSDRRPEVLAGEIAATRSLTPPYERERGFLHLAWVDFSRRLGGPTWPVVLLCLVLFSGGVVCAFAGLDPDQP